ncbi:DUF4097 family beta strand repeat-containing protein [Paenibacillus harenae]|uniref:DUF4097 family beta strand repeat-containing protein n=1 Tax=Paenibacillus harenae TaxID=306543 RepID=UPI000410D677|nr:DUF4097 family beta strand repeat-containing protein [Paenibacillus harenae]
MSGNYIKMGKFMLLAMVAIGLTACSSPVIPLTGKVENAVIGEGSGLGDLVIKEKESFDADKFDSVQVNTDAMEIYMTRSATDTAEVELLIDDKIKNRFTLDASVRAGVLVLDVEEEGKSDRSGKGRQGERKLLIALPDKSYEEVSVDNNFGRVDAADIKSDKVTIKLDAGEIRLNEVTGEMSLETNAGAIEVDGFSLNNHLSAKADVGEIKIHLKEAPEAAELKLKSDIGDVTVDLANVDYEVDEKNEKAGSIGSKGYRIEANTSVGSIAVDSK